MGIRWAGAELCGYIIGEPLLSPLQVQPMLPWKKTFLPLSYRLIGTTHKERLFESAPLSTKYPALLSSVTQGKRECSLKLGHSKCDSLKSYSLRSGQSACPPPACLAGNILNGQFLKSVFMRPEASTLLNLATPNMNLRCIPLRKLELET